MISVIIKRGYSLNNPLYEKIYLNTRYMEDSLTRALETPAKRIRNHVCVIVPARMRLAGVSSAKTRLKQSSL